MAVTPRPPRRPTPARRFGRIFAIFFLLSLGAVGIYGGYAYRHSSALQKYLPGLLNPHNFFHPQTPADVFPGQQALNLMVIGRDYDYSNKDQILKSHARSDVLMVAHLDFDKKDITLLSIPRDTRAQIPGHGVTKINAAHAFGGPALTAQTVQQNFGIPTDKYIALDFNGLEQAINLLGGVDLVVDKQMDYDDNWGHLHIHLKPGSQHLNGEQAMGFVRMRHSDSDLVRIQRQQTLLAALKAKLREPQTLAKLPALLDAIDKDVDSDLSTDQKVVLARFLHDTPREQITMQTLPSLEAGNTIATDWTKATPMIRSIFGVTPPQTVADAPDTVRHHRHHRRHHNARVASLP